MQTFFKQRAQVCFRGCFPFLSLTSIEARATIAAYLFIAKQISVLSNGSECFERPRHPYVLTVFVSRKTIYGSTERSQGASAPALSLYS